MAFRQICAALQHRSLMEHASSAASFSASSIPFVSFPNLHGAQKLPHGRANMGPFGSYCWHGGKDGGFSWIHSGVFRDFFFLFYGLDLVAPVLSFLSPFVFLQYESVAGLVSYRVCLGAIRGLECNRTGLVVSDAFVWGRARLGPRWGGVRGGWGVCTYNPG